MSGIHVCVGVSYVRIRGVSLHIRGHDSYVEFGAYTWAWLVHIRGVWSIYVVRTLRVYVGHNLCVYTGYDLCVYVECKHIRGAWLVRIRGVGLVRIRGVSPPGCREYFLKINTHPLGVFKTARILSQ